MADLYAKEGSVWAAPPGSPTIYDSIDVALDSAAAGDTIYVSDAHDKDWLSVTKTWVSPGTSVNPVYLKCVTDADVDIQSTGALEGTTTGGTMTITGSVIADGVDIQSVGGLFFGGSYANVTLKNGSHTNKASSGFRTMGNSAMNVVTLDNFDLKDTGSSYTQIRGNKASVLIWKNSAYTSSVSGRDELIQASAGGTFIFDNIDLSQVLVGVVKPTSTSTYDIRVTLRRCDLPASLSVISGAIQTIGSFVKVIDCDEANGLRSEYHDLYGSAIIDTGIYLNASYSSQGWSWKASPTSYASYDTPFVFPIVETESNLAAAKTIKINITCDNGANLQDDEVGIQAEYKKNGTTEGVLISDILGVDANYQLPKWDATPADQTTNSESWAGTSGFSAEKTQHCHVVTGSSGVTQGQQGVVEISGVCMANSPAIIYFDADVVIS